MIKPFARYTLLLFCLICSCFACQVEQIRPQEEPLTLLGSWKIGTISTQESQVEQLVTTVDFQDENRFSLTMGKDILISGNYVLSQTDDRQPKEYLTFYGGKHFLKSFLIKERSSTRLGLVLSDEIETDNIYYYVRE